MAMLKRTLPVLFISLLAFFSVPAASAEVGPITFRIGIIGSEPGRLTQNFEPFVEYLRTRLDPAGIRDVTVYVAKDLNSLQRRLREGYLDFTITSALPAIKMEHQGLVPALIAVQGSAREENALFFVLDQSPFMHLSDLRGKTIAFGTPGSTTGYALPAVELKLNGLTMREGTNVNASGNTVRYQFAGEPINRVFRVIQGRADAGVVSSSEWDGISLRERSGLRVIHRTGTIVRLIGSFRPSFPDSLRDTVEQALIDMAGNRKGRAALDSALALTAFERMTEEDRNALLLLECMLAGTNRP